LFTCPEGYAERPIVTRAKDISDPLNLNPQIQVQIKGKIPALM